MSITKQTSIETLVENHPSTLDFLSEKGINCIGRGEPVLGTIETITQDSELTESKVNELVNKLNQLANN
jgi:hypothetical protein